MKPTAALLSCALSFAVLLPGAALAQQAAVQLRLSNTTGQRVDYYFSNGAGGTPQFAGSIEKGRTIDVPSLPGEVLLFATNRKQFQKYTTRKELYQGLALAPEGKQKPPAVAMEYQPPPGAKAKVKTATTTPPPANNAPTTKAPASQPSAETNSATQTVSAAADSSGLAWQYYKFNNPNDQGAVNAQLVLGIPETDAVKMYAQCSSRAKSNFSQVTIYYDVSKYRNNADIAVQFTGKGFEHSLTGKVARAVTGEGLEGIQLAVANDDDLWDGLLALASLNYAIAGKKPQALPLRGSSVPTEKFLRDCRSFASAKQAAVPGKAKTVAPTPAKLPQAQSCDLFGRIKSTNAGSPITVTFNNRTNEYRGIQWLDGDGQPISYGAVEAGESYQVQTSSSHPWMFTDGPGNCIEVFSPNKNSKTFDITIPSSGEGGD